MDSSPETSHPFLTLAPWQNRLPGSFLFVLDRNDPHLPLSMGDHPAQTCFTKSANEIVPCILAIGRLPRSTFAMFSSSSTGSKALSSTRAISQVIKWCTNMSIDHKRNHSNRHGDPFRKRCKLSAIDPGSFSQWKPRSGGVLELNDLIYQGYCSVENTFITAALLVYILVNSVCFVSWTE